MELRRQEVAGGGVVRGTSDATEAWTSDMYEEFSGWSFGAGTLQELASPVEHIASSGVGCGVSACR